MKYCGAVLLLLVVVLTLGQSAAASGYQNGYVADGYTYDNGYWRWGNNYYTRSWYQPNGYYHCGRYYQPTGYYQYYYSHAYQAQVPSYKDPNWKEKVLDIVAHREKEAAKLIASQQEYNQYIETVKLLNISTFPGYPPQAYGQGINYGQLHVGTYGANASTPYVYSQTKLESFYSDGRADILQQQLGRSLEQVGTLFGQAFKDTTDLTNIEGQRRAEVAAILAKGQATQGVALAMAEYAKALQQQGTKIETIQFGTKTEVNGSQPAQQKNVLSLAKVWELSASVRCASCHSGGKKDIKGGFNVADYPNLSPEQQEAVYEVLVTDDLTKRMPRTPDGKVGEKLPDHELLAWRSMIRQRSAPAAK